MSARRLGTATALWGAALGALIAAAACLDVTPVTVNPPGDDAATDGGFSDVSLDSSDDADANSADPCVKCLYAPDDAGAGCAAELAACATNSECWQAFTCALAKHCIENTSIQQVVPCGVPCAVEAGIRRTDDPAVTLAFGVFQCAGGPCRSACNISGGD